MLLKTLLASDTICCGLLAEFWILKAFSSPSFSYPNNSSCSSYRSNSKCSINVYEIKAILVHMSLQNSFHTQPDGEVIYPRNDDLKFGHLVQFQEAHSTSGLELMQERTFRHFNRAEHLKELEGILENIQCRPKLDHKK